MISFHVIPWAVHISDGLLSTSWTVGGFVVAALLGAGAVVLDRLAARWRGQELREEEVAWIALLTSAFFVATLIHIPAGMIRVHLLLNGLVGVVLRWRAALAIPVGLFLQAVLFGHGGMSALGINICVMTVPALLAWLLFGGLHRLPFRCRPWFRATLVALSVNLLLFSAFGSLLLIVSYFLPDASWQVRGWWTVGILFHPLTLIGILLASLALAWAEPRFEHAPEFPLGLFLGVVTVLATMLLNALALVYGGAEDWGEVALLTFVAHLPVAVIEGIVLGSLVGFLAQVKPEMLGLARPPVAVSVISEDPKAKEDMVIAD
jgi:cobalt/nickel transport system permease protein